MGSLKTHKVKNLIDEYKLTAFVETGLYKGEGLEHAAGFSDFESLVSIDILEQWILKGQKKFKDDSRIHLLLGTSFSMLKESAPLVEGHRVLWWLDAHLPESCMGNRMVFKGNKIYDDETTFPLERELEAILSTHDFQKDVFLMDDLRIYENGDYDWGNWNTKGRYNDPGNADFVERLLGDTHTVMKGTLDHGFIKAVPK